jgi:hypothetical protein
MMRTPGRPRPGGVAVRCRLPRQSACQHQGESHSGHVRSSAGGKEESTTAVIEPNPSCCRVRLRGRRRDAPARGSAHPGSARTPGSSPRERPARDPMPVGLSSAGSPGAPSPGRPGKRTPGIIPGRVAGLGSLRVVIPAMTGFLARSSDRHPPRARCVRFTRTGQAGQGFLAA